MSIKVEDKTLYLRYPILFENVADDAHSNGIGALADCLSCQVTQTANTIPTLAMTYKVDGVHAKDIAEGEVIMADASPSLLRQKFRIEEITRSNENITIQAIHIASDFTNRVITSDISLPNANASQCFAALQQALPGLESIPGVEFTTDIADLANINFTVGGSSDMSAILMGEDQIGDTQTQSMQSLYKGNWLFDNYRFQLLRSPGKSTGEVVKKGRDLATVSNDVNVSQMYTGIFPFAKYTPETPQKVPTDLTEVGEPYPGQAVVQYIGAGTLSTYDSPYPGHNPAGSLRNGAKVQILRHLTGDSDPSPVNKHDWYELGDLTWVDGTFITFDKSGGFIINEGSGHGHVTISGGDDKGIIYPSNGTATVTYADNGTKIHVYKSPFKGPDHKRTGETYKNGDRISYTHIAVDENGTKWYQVGKNKWLYGPHLAFDKEGDIAYQPAKGKVWIKDNSKMYKSPGKLKYANGNGVISGSGLKPITVSGGYYDVIGQADEAGTTYYKVANGFWIKKSSCDFKKPKSVKPHPPKDYVNNEAQTNGKLQLHDRPGDNSANGYQISSGTEVDVLGTAEANGESWTQIQTSDGHIGWVLSDNLSYLGLNDIEPSNSENDIDEEEPPAQPELLVTLPDSIVYAENWLGKEFQRIQSVDLSSYFVTHENESGEVTQEDIDQLQQLAESYIKEHRIGMPDPSTTLTEAEIGKVYSADLYDTIGVEYDELGVQTTAQVTSTVFDSLGHKYLSKTIGSLPVSYDHLLLSAADANATGQVNSLGHKVDSNVNFTQQVSEALKQEGSDRVAAIKDIGEQLGVLDQREKDDKEETDGHIAAQKELYNKLNESLEKYSATATEVAGVIDAGGSNELQFWNKPENKQTYNGATEIRAKSSHGGYMIFNSDGLGYFDATGKYVRTGMDSNGTIAAENISAGTISSVTLETVQITAAELDSTVSMKSRASGDDSQEVWIGIDQPWNLKPGNGGNAIYIDAKNFSSMLSSGALYISAKNSNDNNLNMSTTTYLTPSLGQIGGRQIITQGNYDGYIKDYIHKHWVGKSSDWKW